MGRAVNRKLNISWHPMKSCGDFNLINSPSTLSTCHHPNNIHEKPVRRMQSIELLAIQFPLPPKKNNDIGHFSISRSPEHCSEVLILLICEKQLLSTNTPDSPHLVKGSIVEGSAGSNQSFSWSVANLVFFWSVLLNFGIRTYTPTFFVLWNLNEIECTLLLFVEVYPESSSKRTWGRKVIMFSKK